MRFEYFVAPDDETAVLTIDGGEIDGAVASHVVDPASVLGQLERLLGGPTADDGLRSAQLVAESPDGARLLIRLSNHLVTLFGMVRPATLDDVVKHWSRSRRFRRAEPEDLHAFAAGLHELCRGGGKRVYCRATADESELAAAMAPAGAPAGGAENSDEPRPLPRRR
ncbi:hypothetical protein ACFQBY_05785 [Promicromonospora citrea]|uniref:Uncharacterized protein n=1 Tax=Promicromonospora citrea TaxID=43677 RepID=A0A8H9GE08_9MICO|nr:hypothetical protein [Promicromonospora citrea]NNH54185.1 hypothetical protein [Promicromonospora citrea]GGM14427.1 hypothetical protein GCM10010102_07380 [Promicromonospora citrea]